MESTWCQYIFHYNLNDVGTSYLNIKYHISIYILSYIYWFWMLEHHYSMIPIFLISQSTMKRVQIHLPRSFFSNYMAILLNKVFEPHPNLSNCFPYFINTGALNDLFYSICIKMFILKFQASNAEKLQEANIQSPTKIQNKNFEKSNVYEVILSQNRLQRLNVDAGAFIMYLKP